MHLAIQRLVTKCLVPFSKRILQSQAEYCGKVLTTKQTDKISHQ